MTVRHFDGVDDEIITSPMSNPFNGNGTIAVIWRGSDGGNHGLVCAENAGFQRWGVLPVGGDEVYVSYSGFSAVHPWSSGQWYLTIATKASGSSAVRRHSMPFSTGVWTHGDRSNVNDQPSLSHTSVRFGHEIGNSFWLEGELAVVGIWSGVMLSDAECETLDTALINWLDLSPDSLWAFDQASTSDPVVDLTGNGADQSGIVGTTVLTGDDPPGFDFSLTSDTRFYRQGGVWVPTTRQVRVGGAWVPL